MWVFLEWTSILKAHKMKKKKKSTILEFIWSTFNHQTLACLMLHVQATDTSSFGLWRQHSLKKCLQVAAGWKSFSFLLNSAMQINFYFLKNKHLSKQNNSLNSCLLCQLWESTSSNGLLVHISVGVALFPNFLPSSHTLQLRKISPPPPLQLSLSSLHSLPSFVMCGCCQSISVTPL